MASTPSFTARLALAGWRVDCCCVEEDVRLLFLYAPTGTSGLDAFELSLRAPFTLVHNSRRYWLDPRGPRELLGQLLAVYGRVVESASIDIDGVLTVRFTGATLVIEPDAFVEAWTLTGPGQSKVICLPGGDGAVWFDDQQRLAVS